MNAFTSFLPRTRLILLSLEHIFTFATYAPYICNSLPVTNIQFQCQTLLLSFIGFT